VNAGRDAWTVLAILDRSAIGAAIGLVGGLCLLAIGIVRWLVAGAPGQAATSRDLVLAVLYAGAAAGSGASAALCCRWGKAN